jgi:poly(hydroxyalkanoate) granule-associated protein
MAKKKVESGNKYVLAGYGVVATVQEAVEAGFNKLVARGTVARKEYTASYDKFESGIRDDITRQVNRVKDRVVSTYEENAPVKLDDVKARLDSIKNKVAANTPNLFNIPTSKDIAELNKKLDRVIEKVAA